MIEKVELMFLSVSKLGKFWLEAEKVNPINIIISKRLNNVEFIDDVFFKAKKSKISCTLIGEIKTTYDL